MNKGRKKLFFIEPKYTLSFAVRFSGLALLSFTLFGLSLFFLLNRRLGVSYFEDISTLSNIQARLTTILLATGIIQAIALSLVLFILSLLWAHGVAGPLTRFQRYIKMAGRGDLGEAITFRREDQLHYLAQAFRSMQAASKVRRDRYISYLDESDELIREYEGLLKSKGATGSQLKEKLTALEKLYQQMGKV